jgi:subtilase family serine protease
MGVSDIDPTDIQAFRSAFNLPANLPKTILVPGAQDPGMNEAMGEADMDLEWSGAVARNATLLYVYADDPFTAAYYTIDQALAPVISFSFGTCEMRFATRDAQTMANEAQKAASEGITWVAASGDSGAAGCEDQNGAYSSAITRMDVALPAAIPSVTAVGGSEFNEGNFWRSSFWRWRYTAVNCKLCRDSSLSSGRRELPSLSNTFRCRTCFWRAACISGSTRCSSGPGDLAPCRSTARL